MLPLTALKSGEPAEARPSLLLISTSTALGSSVSRRKAAKGLHDEPSARSREDIKKAIGAATATTKAGRMSGLEAKSAELTFTTCDLRRLRSGRAGLLVSNLQPDRPLLPSRSRCADVIEEGRGWTCRL